MGKKRRRSGHRNMLYEDQSHRGTIIALIALVVIVTFAIGMILLWADLQ